MFYHRFISINGKGITLAVRKTKPTQTSRLIFLISTERYNRYATEPEHILCFGFAVFFYAVS